MTTRANAVELERALKMISGLATDAPISEVKGLARAALGDSKPRTPAERAYHVVLRMIVASPAGVSSKGAIETAKTALQVVRQNSNNVIIAWAETYERRIAEIPIDPEVLLKKSPWETCMKLAIQRGWPLPKYEPQGAPQEWPMRSYWTKLLQKERAEAAGLVVPPIGDPPFPSKGAMPVGANLIVTR